MASTTSEQVVEAMDTKEPEVYYVYYCAVLIECSIIILVVVLLNSMLLQP